MLSVSLSVAVGVFVDGNVTLLDVFPENKDIIRHMSWIKTDLADMSTGTVT